MKATEAKLLDFLKKSPQFVVPIYQRTYSWTERQCSQLWNDIIRSGSDSATNSYFVGSIVYIEKGIFHVTSQAPLLVIDGQQRLTTISILLEALARHLGDSEPVDGFSAKKIRHYYLLNNLEEGDRAFKLLLTQTDKESLLALVQQHPMPPEHSLRLQENFDYFTRCIERLNGNYTTLCRGLAKLIIVDVALNRDQDNPQLIFESMNSTGRDLSQADLIRNYVLMRLEPDHQKKLYEMYWRPMEVEFGQEAYSKNFDSFMRHYLTLKTGEIPKISSVYEVFKSYAQKPHVAAQGIDELVANIRVFATYYCAMELDRESDQDLAVAFRDLRDLKVDVAYPFLLELYHDYTCGVLRPSDFLAVIRLVESYVFRRAVCSIPPSSLNKTFATFGRVLHKEHYLESIQAHFILMPSYKRFPNDDEFQRVMKTRDLYNFRSKNYWLRRLENDGRKEPVPVGEYTIEHIMPQNQKLSEEWKQELGPEWRRVQSRWLHTLGNLTLTGYNSEYSDRPFSEKRNIEGGFRFSPLRLNQEMRTTERWNEEAITRRADLLAAAAARVWSMPTLPTHVLDGYKPAPEVLKYYTLEDHVYLVGAVRSLFDELRSALIALAPEIQEEVRKKYIAYTLGHDVVAVIPQATQLKLFLNMKFGDIDDPEMLCKDVSGKRHSGRGDVKVLLKSADTIPLVLNLVRQVLQQHSAHASTAAEVHP